MNIGSLSKKIKLQSEVKTSDSMGGFTSVWKDEASVWAAIWPVSASEQIQAMQVVMSITHRIRIRYREDLKSHWRVKLGSRYFAIVSVINPGENSRMLELMCKEITA